MAAQLSETVPHVALHQAQQAVHADLLRVCLPTPSAIERRHVTDGGVFAERHTVSPRQVQEMGEQPRVPVHVVVRVEMGWGTAH